MARISLWLPPFSPDYSGAAAVLFDLKTVTAMHDGSGCTGNYTGYDEPRWYGSASGIFCSGLREIDAVLGDDEKLIRKMIRAAEDIRPDILALIGSPVPMVIGADLAGIARELEERTGIVSMGFNTTGTAYYDKGAYMAAAELLRRFAPSGERRPGRVNILGALPMDFYKGRETALLKAFLEDAGYEVGLTLAMDYTLEQLRRAGTAQVNVAVSRFGLLTARYMEREYGIPYLCGFPAGGAGAAGMACGAGADSPGAGLPDLGGCGQRGQCAGRGGALDPDCGRAGDGRFHADGLPTGDGIFPGGGGLPVRGGEMPYGVGGCQPPHGAGYKGRCEQRGV